MNTNHDDLWGAHPIERLQAARVLKPQDLQSITKDFLKGCPLSSWPYGCNTSINPWIVFLGPSPGASPAADDINFVTRDGIPPTTGTPPPGSMGYSDNKGFFKRLRSLTASIIRAEVNSNVSEFDAYSLAGMMNLASGASGEASNVMIDPVFARWAIDTSFRRLRPRYVVCVGLKGFLKNHRWLLDAISEYTGCSFNPDRPPISKPFNASTKTRLTFSAWPLLNDTREHQHLILFPQHPGKPPMKSPEIWDEATCEFVAFAKSL